MKKILSAILVLLSISLITACSLPFPTEEHAGTAWLSNDGRMYIEINSDGKNVSGDLVLSDNQRVSYMGEFADNKLTLRLAKTITFDGKRMRIGTEIGIFGYEYNGTTFTLMVDENKLFGVASGQVMFRKMAIN